MKNSAISKEQQSRMTPESVLRDLMDGNKRFMEQKDEAVFAPFHCIDGVFLLNQNLQIQ